MHTPFSFVDQLCLTAQGALKTLSQKPLANRQSPGDDLEEAQLTEQQQKHIAGLMRINHCGEVCAQALYQGQALTADLPDVREKMALAAEEENDHLAWCQQRLDELGHQTSKLNPLFFITSFLIGASAGKIGDKWSLGFVAETENQVVEHLKKHLNQLPEGEEKSKAIIQQMIKDEGQHATQAKLAGGQDLPIPIKLAMTAMSKVMTQTTYHW